MADGKEKTQRRVYVLPNDLVDRIVAYQEEMGLTSEVEAARRLLDDALKYRDTYETLITRFLGRYEQVRTLREAARDILADHPLISSISYKDGLVQFEMTTGLKVNINSQSKATVRNYRDQLLDLGPNVPSWASKDHTDEVGF